MPIYEYICTKCNERFSLLQNVNTTEKDTACPGCSSEKVKKLMSSFSCSAGSDSVYSSSMPSRGMGGGG